MVDEILHKAQTIEKADEVNQQKQYHFVGSTKKQKGQILWEYNANKHTIVEAEIKSELIYSMEKEGAVKTHKLIQETGCTYFWALNLKNAQRKVARKLGL